MVINLLLFPVSHPSFPTPTRFQVQTIPRTADMQTLLRVSTHLSWHLAKSTLTPPHFYFYSNRNSLSNQNSSTSQILLPRVFSDIPIKILAAPKFIQTLRKIYLFNHTSDTHHHSLYLPQELRSHFKFFKLTSTIRQLKYAERVMPAAFP